jgi:hypothetical protein
MKDSALAVHQAYYTRLKNASGLWDVYDRPPGTGALPYILIESVVTQDNSTKTTRGQIAIVQLSANIAYTGDAGGKKEAEDMGSRISQVIDDRANRIDCASEFHVVTTKLESAVTIEEQRTEPKNVVRRVLRFRHHVEEL